MSEIPIDETAFRGDLPDVTQERIDNVYKVIGSLNVSLDPDPLAFGPKRLNQKIAETRAHKSRIGRLFNQISHDLGIYRRELRKLEAAVKIAHDYLLTTDPEVRAGSNVADREAAVTIKLRRHVERKMKLEAAIRDLEEVMTVVKAKRSDIGDTQGRLRDQMKMCQEELAVGHRWGSKAPGSSQIKLEEGQALATAADVSDIDDLIAEVEGEIHVARERGEWIDPEFDPEGDDEDGDEDSVEEESLDDEEEEEEGAEAEGSRDEEGAEDSEEAPSEGGDEEEDGSEEQEEVGDALFSEEKSPENGPDVAENPEAPALTDTATDDEVDSFLENLELPSEQPRHEKKKIEPPVEDPIDFDALLNS